MIERSRLGRTDGEAVARVRAELEDRFLATAAALSERAARVVAHIGRSPHDARDTATIRSWFVRLSQELPDDAAGIAGLTVFDPRGAPIAWAGRVSDLPREQISRPGLSVLVDALGIRLRFVALVPDPARPQGPPLAAVVSEQLLGDRASPMLGAATAVRLRTAAVEVSVRPVAGTDRPSDYAFVIRSAGGEPLVRADVAPADVAAGRRTWAERRRAAWLGVVACTLLWCAAPLLDLRRHARAPGSFAAATTALVALLVGARGLLGAALAPIATRETEGPLELLPSSLLLVALVWLALDTIERRRVSPPRPVLLHGRSALVLRGAALMAAGAMVVAAVVRYERVLADITARSSHDLLRFSLHPLDLERLATASAVVLLHASVVWGGAAVLRLPMVLWRVQRRPRLGLVWGLAATVGAALAFLALRRFASPVPDGPLLLAASTAGLMAAALARPRGTARRASQAARLGLLFAGLVLPALAFYPSLHALAVAAKERLIDTTFAPEVANQREDLQARQLPLALEAIDAMTALPQFVSSTPPATAAPVTDRAFLVWAQTVLSDERTTSAVELYAASGALVSRFALNLPEYVNVEYRGGSCTEWELYEEVSPFGTLSTLRNVLRASRAICEDRRRVGAIVVRVRLDYHALPFISTQSPYLQSLTPASPSRPETASGSDVELVVYGWSRAPLYASGTKVWPLADDVFDGMSEGREPLWTRVNRDGETFRVYFFNDRGGIYALGYPVITRFGHLVNLGELVFLTGVLYMALLLAASAFNLVSGQTPAGGRALLREVRSSFYRKLFIAFVAAAVIPVVVLALATSTYFANQFRADVEESAVKTATVAQRLVEDYVALQQRGAGSLDRIDDEFMLLVRRAIDEDVNLFDGARLQATSERPLFVSRLLPSRTSAEVYRAIVLDRLPTAVVVEQGVGTPGYLVAAAPVRARGREGIVTVPQTLRQREIEAQIDEIDRRVLSAAVLFVLLGSALGYWMAERIADPVNRLTRATRRIARGDLDARIAATSSDELRRLVEDFNQMASDLQQQRVERERTQRLEAWAEMARQVAHDIKNPLTPIQLSAEHARRVNQDRGRPLSPILDECVASILSQVTLLRQISTEFSSFASSPVPRPESADLGAILEEVVEPYRAGLEPRIGIDLDIEPGLPAAWVDRTLFGRALTNVIENALHAMPGTGALTIRARLAAAGPGTPAMLRVDVTDTGIGMDAEALARIFEPYFSTKATGTGLGLTIARRNLELLGGRVEVHSERGVGTTVSLSLPAAQP